MAGQGKGLRRYESEGSLLDLVDVSQTSSEDETSVVEKESEKGGRNHISGMPESALTLAGIIRQIHSLSGNPANVPTFFFSGESGKLLENNANIFIQAVVRYAHQIPPHYWHMLFPSQERVKGMNVVVDPSLFPADFKFAGNMQKDGSNEVPIDQLNWHGILQDCRRNEFKSILKNGKTRALKDDIRSIEKFMAKTTSKSSGEFARIICSLLIKLFDGKMSSSTPNKALRVRVLGAESFLLEGYEKMKSQNFGNEGLNWNRKLALEPQYSQFFPNCIPVESCPAILEEECITDNEETDEPYETTGFSQFPVSSIVTRQKPGLIPLTTLQSIRQTEEEIAAEEKRESNYIELATISRSRIEALETKLVDLKRQQVKEEADGKLIQGVYNTMTHEEYIQNSDHVPEVVRDVFEAFRVSGCTNFAEYWKACVTKLNSQGSACVTSEELEPGSSSGEPNPISLLELDWETGSAAHDKLNTASDLDVNLENLQAADDFPEVVAQLGEVPDAMPQDETIQPRPTGVAKALGTAKHFRKKADKRGKGQLDKTFKDILKSKAKRPKLDGKDKKTVGKSQGEASDLNKQLEKNSNLQIAAKEAKTKDKDESPDKSTQFQDTVEPQKNSEIVVGSEVEVQSNFQTEEYDPENAAILPAMELPRPMTLDELGAMLFDTERA